DLAFAAELCSAKDVTGPDDDAELCTTLHRALGLPSHIQCLVDADAALAAGVSEALAAQFQDDAPVLWLEDINSAKIVHGMVHVCAKSDVRRIIAKGVKRRAASDF